jgi:hypothetical protein
VDECYELLGLCYGVYDCFYLSELGYGCIWFFSSSSSPSSSSTTLRFFIYLNIYLSYYVRRSLAGSTPSMRSSKLVIFGLIASL